MEIEKENGSCSFFPAFWPSDQRKTNHFPAKFAPKIPVKLAVSTNLFF